MPVNRPLQAADPTSLAGYRLTGRLGQGGQGIVYLGIAPDGQQAAIKVLNAETAAEPGFRRRFQREAAAAQRVASFCTAQVLDASFDVEQPYIVSEYVDGHSLAADVKRNGPHTGTELHRLAVATATALVAVHEAGIVHRDFKPANVLMAAQGPRVIDFGVAANFDVSTIQTQSVVGTPSYMAPEQIMGKPTTPAVDVFSWGSVMVFAATGRAPFSGSNVFTVLNQVLSDEADLSGMDENWRSIVARCLAKDPADRPTSADLLMLLLGRRDPDDAGGRTLVADTAITASTGHRTGDEQDEQAGRDEQTGHSEQTGGDERDRHDERNGRDEHDGRAGSGRRRLAVIGAVLGLILVSGAGGYTVWASRDSSPPAVDNVAAEDAPSAVDTDAAAPDSPSPSQSSGPESDASPDTSLQAEAQGPPSSSPSAEPEDSDEAPEEDGDQVTFPEALAGHWVGHGDFPDKIDRDYDLVIEAGSTTASMTTRDNACTWNFTLFRTNTEESGVDGSMTSNAGCGPHKNAGFWADGDRLAVLFWGKDGSYLEQFFMLERP